MLSLQKHAPPLAAITVATVALAAVMPTIAPADPSTPVAHTAKKKKKKKKAEPLTATVNGAFTVRYDDPLGFGQDNGPRWQQLKVVIKGAEIRFPARNRHSASARVPVRFEYVAEAHTEDRSSWPGCDREDRETHGAWSGLTGVGIVETQSVRTNGITKKYLGWQVIAPPPVTGIETVSSGSFQQWESLLMTNCLTVPITEPLGGWSTGFAQPDGLGKLSSDGRSVRLNEINTEVDQTASVSGSIKFNKPVGR